MLYVIQGLYSLLFYMYIHLVFLTKNLHNVIFLVANFHGKVLIEQKWFKKCYLRVIKKLTIKFFVINTVRM